VTTSIEAWTDSSLFSGHHFSRYIQQAKQYDIGMNRIEGGERKKTVN